MALDAARSRLVSNDSVIHSVLVGLIRHVLLLIDGSKNWVVLCHQSECSCCPTGPCCSWLQCPCAHAFHFHATVHVHCTVRIHTTVSMHSVYITAHDSAAS